MANDDVFEEHLELERKARIEFEKKIIRRLDIQQRNLDTIDSEREIIEGIVSRMAGVEEAITNIRRYFTLMAADFKNEIQINSAQVTQDVGKKVDNLEKVVENKPVIVKKQLPWYRRIFRNESKVSVKSRRP